MKKIALSLLFLSAVSNADSLIACKIKCGNRIIKTGDIVESKSEVYSEKFSLEKDCGKNRYHVSIGASQGKIELGYSSTQSSSKAYSVTELSKLLITKGAQADKYGLVSGQIMGDFGYCMGVDGKYHVCGPVYGRRTLDFGSATYIDHGEFAIECHPTSDAVFNLDESTNTKGSFKVSENAIKKVAPTTSTSTGKPMKNNSSVKVLD